MHIAFFTNTYYPWISGVVHSVSLFRQALSDLGNNVFVFAQHAENYIDQEPFIFRYPALTSSWPTDISAVIPISPSVGYLIPSLKLDVIHAHHPILLGRTAANKAAELNLPLVFTFHSQYAEYSQYIPLNKETIYDFIKLLIDKWLGDFMQKCNHIVVPTASMLERLEEEFDIRDKISVIPTGIDLKHFQNVDGHPVRERHGWQDDIVMISVGRLSPEKNWKRLLEASAKAWAVYPKLRNHIADAWRVPRERLADTTLLKNPGMVMGMLERALKGELYALFFIYTTHVHLPDADTLVRPAMQRMFVVTQDIYRHAPNNLYSDVILPAATWGEWAGGTYVQSERRLYICDGTKNPPGNCLPDIDLAIDMGRGLANRLGLDGERIFPYEKKIKLGNGLLAYDPEEVFRDIITASKGADCDLNGMLEVEKEDGVGLYDQLRRLRGVQWPAPTAEIARKGGTPRRYLGQEGWAGKPYGSFRHKDGKAQFKLCEQDYTQLKAVTAKLMTYGHKSRPGFGPYLIDEMADAASQGRKNVLEQARDAGLPPELPDIDVYQDTTKGLDYHKEKDKYPFWLSLGIVYEHFHTSKTTT